MSVQHVFLDSGDDKKRRLPEATVLNAVVGLALVLRLS